MTDPYDIFTVAMAKELSALADKPNKTLADRERIRVLVGKALEGFGVALQQEKDGLEKFRPKPMQEMIGHGLSAVINLMAALSKATYEGPADESQQVH